MSVGVREKRVCFSTSKCCANRQCLGQWVGGNEVRCDASVSVTIWVTDRSGEMRSLIRILSHICFRVFYVDVGLMPSDRI